MADVAINLQEPCYTNETFPYEERSTDLHFPTDNLHPLREVLNRSLRDEKLAQLIHTVLENQGLDRYEKTLGSGAFGIVIQLDGTGLFDGKKLALKIIPKGYQPSSTYYEDTSSDFYNAPLSYTPSAQQETSSITPSSSPLTEQTITPLPSNSLLTGAWTISRIAKDRIIGDGVALNFPRGGSLLPAYGLLLFDGETVIYTETINYSSHQGMAVIGVISPLASGGSLAGRMISTLSMTSEEVKTFGITLAQAIHELHGQGYAHRDIHSGNILLHEDSNGKYTPLLADFGLCTKLNKRFLIWDWSQYSYIMEDLLAKTTTEPDPEFKEILASISQKIDKGSFDLLDEKVLLAQLCFA
ncbi:MAG: protein kinase family protein [Chlamydiia bacterium]|nr:protein kinase family protein [Chlamydiia bacterium]